LAGNVTAHVLGAETHSDAFPPRTIGLASWLASIEWRWLRTKDDLWRDLYFFMAEELRRVVRRGRGVRDRDDSQFGTNWVVLSQKAGNILGRC
jgi:cytochrome d ubiquinol oxidase subunit I